MTNLVFLMRNIIKMQVDCSELEKQLNKTPLGKISSYIDQYDPKLLVPIPRKNKRYEINIPDKLPFTGFDTWNAYEVSWLNLKGKPIVAIVQFDIPCTSINIVESKSFKLYLNSFNNTKFASYEKVKSVLQEDISNIVNRSIQVKLTKLEEVINQKIINFQGICLDNIDLECTDYSVNPNYLSINDQKTVKESLFSNLLKSNCLVTGQPDWGSILIEYQGPEINKEGLLKYLISFRNHNEFHEQCVERIFIDIKTYCLPKKLTIEARYTRRGGLDINPIRSTQDILPSVNIRMPRQ